ncbi:uncharacterized protein MKZ38_007499 [Zalerion maritima]|uniref:Nucleoside phosphorylase domain-containing protein n=1 Tax=Zalerion maritima TaxID=339359 RepID=A0AAD5RIE5_9PEZI|nr:uncharacterized protein MKZ38_007499 [Zalerion maritima]
MEPLAELPSTRPAATATQPPLPPSPSNGDFEIAIFCALTLELIAAKAALDHCWDSNPDSDLQDDTLNAHYVGRAPADINSYTTGRIGRHNVVLVAMPHYGKISATAVATNCKHSFPKVKLALVVGICGGVPTTSNAGRPIALGDVVLSNGVIQYDLGRQYEGTFKRNTDLNLPPASDEVKSLLANLQSDIPGLESKVSKSLRFVERKLGSSATYPGVENDYLYDPSYPHKHHHLSSCPTGVCASAPASSCDDAAKATCQSLKCDKQHLLPRTRSSPHACVHMGVYASGDTVVKSSQYRDKLASESEGIIAFEMEAPGIWARFGGNCLVVKSVCDYADSHKNKLWQGYSAATAAACTRSLVLGLPVTMMKTLPEIPVLNKDVVVRHDLLGKLEELLPHDDGRKGNGGGFDLANQELPLNFLWLRKTQLALSYAHRRISSTYHHCPVFWVNADTDVTFTQDYKTIASYLDVSPALEDKDLLEAVRMALEKESRWLLVLDNVDDLRLFGINPEDGSAIGRTEGDGGLQANEEQAVNLRDFVPRRHSGTVLWTTRDGYIEGSLVNVGQAIRVPSMSLKEASQLFGIVRGRPVAEDETHDAQAVFLELDHLPLAITQAAAYIRRTSTTLSQYLVRIGEQQRRLAVLAKAQPNQYRPHVKTSILATWQVSIERMRQESEAAYRILHVLPFVDNQNIPREILVIAAGFGRRFKTVKWNGDYGRWQTYFHDHDEAEEEDVEEAIMRLRDFSFIGPAHGNTEDSTSQAYEMHKLVQDAARWNLSQKPQDQGLAHFSRAAILAMAYLFPLSEEGQQKTWGACERYLTHALRASEWSEMAGENVDAATLLLERLSCYLGHRSRWREREPVDKTRRTLLENAFGKEDLRSISSIFSLSVTLDGLGRSDECIQMEEHALGVLRRKLGNHSRDTINASSSYAISLRKMGRFSEAEDILTKTLRDSQQALGEADENTTAAMVRLAGVYKDLGRYWEAEKLEEKVFKLRRDALGENHPRTLESMHNLAATYLYLGRFEDAKKLFDRVWKFRCQEWGEHHPLTVLSLSGLARVYCELGHKEKAAELEKKVLTLQMEILGEYHPNTLIAMGNLAGTYSSMGLYEKAESFEQRVLLLRQRLLGEEHPDAIRAMVNLGVTLHRLGKHEEAEKFRRQAFLSSTHVLGESHSDTLFCEASLAATLTKLGRHEEARELFEEALERQRETLGEKHPDTLYSLYWLAHTRYSLGNLDAAVDLMDECAQGRRSALSHGHPETKDSETWLGTWMEEKAEQGGVGESAGAGAGQCMPGPAQSTDDDCSTIETARKPRPHLGFQTTIKTVFRSRRKRVGNGE